MRKAVYKQNLALYHKVRYHFPFFATTSRTKDLVRREQPIRGGRKLIRHLPLTEENFNTAWTLLQERYNTKRLLVATLVEKFLSQPTGSSSPLSIKALHDTTRECLLAMNNLGIDTSSWNAIIVQLIIHSLNKPKEMPTIGQLLSIYGIHWS